MKRKEFLNYINNFRGIAILYIVMGHCISAFTWHEYASLKEVLRLTFTNGTILFVFIAGYLFQYLSYKYQYGRYMKSKVLNVGMPYVIMSVPAIIYFTLFAQRPGMEYINDWPWILRVIQFYLVGAQLIPFWFIPMIFIHFFLSPLYIVGDRNKVLYYLLPVFFVISLFVWRGGPYQLQSYLHYAFVYFFGMFLCRYRESVNRILARPGVLLWLAAAVVGFILFEFHMERGTLLAKRLNMIQHLFQCLFYIGFLIRFDPVIGKRMDLFASLSFGVFFIHSYLISIIKQAQLHFFGSLWVGTYWNFPLFFAAIVLLSMGFVLTVRRYAGSRSRMICGS